LCGISKDGDRDKDGRKEGRMDGRMNGWRRRTRAKGMKQRL
jgi:hypothetical protein